MSIKTIHCNVRYDINKNMMRVENVGKDNLHFILFIKNANIRKVIELVA